MKMKVQVNGESAVVGGNAAADTLTCIVNSRRESDRDPETQLELFAGHGTTHQTESWIKGRDLRPGDVVTITVLGDSAERVEPGARTSEEDERVYYEIAKSAYFRLRDKYEPAD